ncbi:MAG: inositol monophosphatase [Rhizobiaceae bacterium MnEN-MB40S]|nr:MAG: inositol monophosphatase [Rhizobiaceae bacterium MnEN-MB40S]
MTFLDKDIDALDGILRRAAEEQIAPRFRRLEDNQVQEKKSALDLVTEADVAAEHAIEAALREAYPEAIVVGEEAAAKDPAIIGALHGAELAFVIDPIDGTFNFASDMPLFGVMLAVVVKGECVAGVIHYPVSGESLMGLRGAGSRLVDEHLVSRPARVAEPVPLSDMIGNIFWSYMEEPRRSRVAANMAKIAMTFQLRCSAWEYRVVATGKAHFIGGQQLMPWDHLAGVLIHQEAGGYSARLDGSPYLPGMTDGGLITAPDRETWRLIRSEIIGD